LLITTNARAEILNFAIDILVASCLLKDTNQGIKKQRQYLNNDASFLLNDSDGFEHFKRKFSTLQCKLFNVASQVLHALEKQREGAMESDGLFLNKNNIQTWVSTEQNAEVGSFPFCLKET